MKTRIIAAIALSIALSLTAHAQVPGIINYQGRITSGGTNFNGTGQFQFALLSGTNTARQATATANLSGPFVTTYTVTDGGAGYTSGPAVTIIGGGGSGAAATSTVSGGVVISIAGTNAGSGYTSPPAVIIGPPPPNIVATTAWSNGVNTVSLPVTKGLYSVLLGDTTLANMNSSIPATVFTNADVLLRVWFNDGVNGLQQLSPDQRLGAVGYAMVANVPAGAITSAQLAPNLTISGNFSAGSISINGVPFLYTVGLYNNFVGGSGNLTMSGSDNTANGAFALSANTSGQENTANGAFALQQNTSGFDNTANGMEALVLNTSGYENTANGAYALYSNTNGYANTANGYQSLTFNGSGYQNTANGAFALQSNTSGYDNTANGHQALFSNTSGFGNTANGDSALYSNRTGTDNAANGSGALGANTSGSGNTADGYVALAFNTNGNFNTATGFQALLSNMNGSYNIAIGYEAGYNLTTGDNNINIGNTGVAAEGNVIRIGTVGTQTNTYIAGISGVTAAGGVAVFVTAAGKLGTITSSRRFKEAIQDMGSQSDVLLSLRPVAFRYKTDIDPAGIPQFGLIAEEVEKVAADLVLRDAKGEVYTVRYEQINAMLLNEFLKEHRQVQDLEWRLAQMEKRLEQVSEQVEQSKATPQQASNVRNQGGM